MVTTRKPSRLRALKSRATAARRQRDATKVSKPSEWQIWMSVWHGDRARYPECTPTESAVDAVFARALAPDLIPIDIVDDLGTMFESMPSLRNVRRTAQEMAAAASDRTTKPADAVALAATVFRQGRCIWIGTHDITKHDFSAHHRMVDTLNRYPLDTSLAAWWLAPALRMLCSPPPGPEWLFGYLARMRVARRRKPWLLPDGIPESLPWSAPVDYGWECLEDWVLRVWRREPLTFEDTNERIATAVTYTVRTMQDLVRQAPAIGPAALEFEEICRPLRRCLFWYATAALNDAARRKYARDLLRQLADAMIPALPPREPVVLEYYHTERYEEMRQLVSEVWRETKRRGRLRRRRAELERRLGNLTPVGIRPGSVVHPMTKELKRMQDGFWRDCGDLSVAQPGHVARCYLKHFLRIELEPRQIKERLAQADAMPPFRRRSVGLGRETWSEQSYPPLGY